MCKQKVSIDLQNDENLGQNFDNDNLQNFYRIRNK